MEGSRQIGARLGFQPIKHPRMGKYSRPGEEALQHATATRNKVGFWHPRIFLPDLSFILVEARLRGAGIVRVDEVVKDDAGHVVELRGWLDPESRPGMEGANRKVKGTIHWVSAQHAVAAEIRLYDRLFSVEKPDDESDGRTYRDHLNPDSKKTVAGWIEPAAAQAAPEQSFQFERSGYFVADRRDHTADKPVFNRSVTLRDTWAAG